MASPRIQEQVEELTRYEINWLQAGEPEPPGAVTVSTPDGRRIAVGFQNEAYANAQRAVLLTTVLVVLIGGLAFTVIAAYLAWRTARPVERLASAARRIGAGDWDQPVAAENVGELAGLAADLEGMRCRLRELDSSNRQAERLATLGTFTATIAHEVRNPLSAVQLTIQLMQRNQPDDQRLTMVRDELARLDLIIDELLAFSRGIDVQLEACDLAAVAADSYRMLQRQAEHADVELQVSGSGECRQTPTASGRSCST